MKYDELINKCEGGEMRFGHLPIGILYKRQADKKFINVINLHDTLVDDILFNKDIELECNANSSINDEHQVHFVRGTFDCGADMLTVEQGNFVSIEQLYNENPNISANNKFIESFIFDLLSFLSLLNSQGIYHICISPSNIFVRKGELSPLLMSHGSYYLNLPNQSLFYSGQTNYVAPEVLNENKADSRSDVYSVGKFIEYLFSIRNIPYAYKSIIRKATEAEPEKRYVSIDSMRNDLKMRLLVSRILNYSLVFIVSFLLILFVYNEFSPKVNEMEFIKPHVEQTVNELEESTFDPISEYSFADTISSLTTQENEEMKKYQEKCEQIFRKQYTKEAERVLSQIYSSSNMGTNVNNFIVGSQSAVNELVKLRVEIAGKSGLDEFKSQRLATEIIDQITERKKKALLKHGVQKE